MAIPSKDPFTLTRPKVGAEYADYFLCLRRMLESTITGLQIRSRGQNMTYQALREKNLIVFNKNIKAYEITEAGRLYVSVVESANVVPRSVLLEIMKKDKKVA